MDEVDMVSLCHLRGLHQYQQTANQTLRVNSNDEGNKELFENTLPYMDNITL